MGISSRPLFVTTPDLVVRTAEVSGHIHELFERLFENGIFKKETFTLGEFMSSFSEARIWGYWDTMPTWVDFMKSVRSQNPDAPPIQFHFYCEEECPFYFECREDSSCWYFQYSHLDFLEHLSDVVVERYEGGDGAVNEFHAFNDEYYREKYTTLRAITGLPIGYSNNMVTMSAQKSYNRLKTQ